MSNLTKIEFAALEVSGKNYMSWVIDVKAYLASMGILDTIKENNNCSLQDKWKAIFILRKHVDIALKFEYLNIEDPFILWNSLKGRFDNQKKVLLPSAREEWRSLRFQDFKKVTDYSSALFRICSQLEFCGQPVTDEDMLEKTYSTFHVSNITLQENLRLQNFSKYSDLHVYLLMAEQNNVLLLKNHESRPTGSVAFPEVNVIENVDPRNNIQGRGRGRGRGRFTQNRYLGHNNTSNRNHNFSRGHYYGRGSGSGRGRGRRNGRGPRNNNYYVSRGNKTQPQNKTTKHDGEASTSQNLEGSCYRCGSLDHWSRACRTPSHLCKLYQASLKEKGNEVNFVEQFDCENAELNASDFLNDIE